MSIKDIRQTNLLAVIHQKTDGNIAEFSRRYTLNDKYMRHVKSGASMGSRFARKVEAALARVDGGDWSGWMDREHLESDALLVARRWATLNPARRAFVLGQMMLAETLNFGETREADDAGDDYAKIMDHFRKAAPDSGGIPPQHS